MFGIWDRLYSSRKIRDSHARDKVDWAPMVGHNDGENSWFCFVPKTVIDNPFLRKRIIPSDGEVFVYTISSLGLMKPDTDETLRGLQEIYEDAIDAMSLALEDGHKLNILGVSLGNVFAIRAAGSVNNRIGRLVSIVGGDRLGLSAWDSILTGQIARQSGCGSAEEYEGKLSAFSPINYVQRVVADEILVRLGTRDLLIPFKHGRELASAFRERSVKTRAKFDSGAYRGADHCGVLFLSAYQNVVNHNNAY